eukprot:s622_g17.t1
MNLLIRAGANVNSRNEMLGGGTALHVASRMAWFEGMERLLERDANPNATDRLAQAPLHGAARRVDLRAVSLLLRSRANVHAIGPEGRRAVDFVADSEGVCLPREGDAAPPGLCATAPENHPSLRHRGVHRMTRALRCRFSSAAKGMPGE